VLLLSLYNEVECMNDILQYCIMHYVEHSKLSLMTLTNILLAINNNNNKRSK